VIHRLRSKLVGLEPHRIQAVPRRGYGIFEPTAQAPPDEPARPMEELYVRLARAGDPHGRTAPSPWLQVVPGGIGSRPIA
jgi:hypothetical protein